DRPGELAGLAFEPPPAPEHEHEHRHHHNQIDAQRDEQRNQHRLPSVPPASGQAGAVTRPAPAPMTPVSGRIIVMAALSYTNGTRMYPRRARADITAGG